MIALLRDFILALSRRRYLNPKEYVIPYSKNKVILENENGLAETEETGRDFWQNRETGSVNKEHF